MKMVKVKTADLSGSALDWAVGKAEGAKMFISSFNRPSFWPGDNDHIDWLRNVKQSMDYPCVVSPSTSWSQGGELISNYRVSIIYSDEECDPCAWTDDTAAWHGPTPLIAAMRAIVAAKLGDEVEVPGELVQR